MARLELRLGMDEKVDWQEGARLDHLDLSTWVKQVVNEYRERQRSKQ